jgi:hypothetical protein
VALRVLNILLFFKRQVPDLPHATSGPSKKAKKNKSGIEGRIMDPLARSAAQRAAKEARNAARDASAAPEEWEASITDDEIMDIEPEESSAPRLQPAPPPSEVSVRYFIFF